MNYYENKRLEEREGRMIGLGAGLIVTSPAFGIVTGICTLSTAGFYTGTAAAAALGLLSIYAALKQRRERKLNQHA